MLKGGSSCNERYVKPYGIPPGCYNQACVYASEIPHLTRGMRHLDLAEMLIKEKDESKEIKLLKVASADNTSDLGTKRLALPLFNKLTSRIIEKSLRVNL